MGIRIFLSVVISIFTVLATITPSSAKSLEEKYIETRNSFITEFNKETSRIDAGQALAELENQLRTIVGSVDIQGFSKQGRINLTGLQNEPGLTPVDGLRFDSNRESLFVTSETLLKNYLADHPELPRQKDKLSATEDFYRLVFHADAGVALYAAIPVQSKPGLAFANAFLGVSTQETGPFVPDEIFVFAARERQILLFNASSTIEIKDISDCRQEWDKFERMSSDALKLYQSSQLKNHKAFDDSIRFRELGFETYRHCYARNIRTQPFFAPLQAQVQSLISRLQNGN